MEPTKEDTEPAPKKPRFHLRTLLSTQLGVELSPETIRALPPKAKQAYRVLLDRLREQDKTIDLLDAALEDERRKRRAAEALSDTDPLTGLANRRAVVNELDGMRTRRQKRPDARRKNSVHYPTATIVKIDLNDLGSFNNLYDETAGDLAIKHLGKVTKAHLRDTDYIARYGGDEFLLILRNTTLAEARRKMKVIMKAVAETPFEFIDAKGNTHTLHVSGSYGATEMKENDTRQQISSRLKIDITKHKIKFWETDGNPEKRTAKLNELKASLSEARRESLRHEASSQEEVPGESSPDAREITPHPPRGQRNTDPRRKKPRHHRIAEGSQDGPGID